MNMDDFTLFLIFASVLGIVAGYLRKKGYMFFLYPKKFKNDGDKKAFLRIRGTHDIVQSIGFLLAAVWNEVTNANMLLIALITFISINGLITFYRSRKYDR